MLYMSLEDIRRSGSEMVDELQSMELVLIEQRGGTKKEIETRIRKLETAKYCRLGIRSTVRVMDHTDGEMVCLPLARQTMEGILTKNAEMLVSLADKLLGNQDPFFGNVWDKLNAEFCPGWANRKKTHFEWHLELNSFDTLLERENRTRHELRYLMDDLRLSIVGEQWLLYVGTDIFKIADGCAVSLLQDLIRRLSAGILDWSCPTNSNQDR